MVAAHKISFTHMMAASNRNHALRTKYTSVTCRMRATTITRAGYAALLLYCKLCSTTLHKQDFLAELLRMEQRWSGQMRNTSMIVTLASEIVLASVSNTLAAARHKRRACTAATCERSSAAHTVSTVFPLTQKK